MRFDGLIFDFDGVLLESEYAGNRQIADYLTSRGHPTTPEESMAQFMGLAGHDFIAAIERWIGRTVPDDFHTERKAEDRRALAEGLDPVAGAVAFVRALPASLPRAIASSSSTEWIERHLDHLGIRDAFGDKIFSGREHVERGKPAPDLYLHAAQLLDVAPDRCLAHEDTDEGITAATAAGMSVIDIRQRPWQ